MSDVYTITNTTTGRVYVGGSLNAYRRFAEHRYRLKTSRANQRMMKDYDAHGLQSFIFAIVEHVNSPADLKKREQAWIWHLRTFENGYNVDPKSDSPRGRIQSPEANLKRSIALKGRKKHAGHGAKVSKALKGRKHAPEHTAKIAASRRNRNQDPAEIQKYRERARQIPEWKLFKIFELARTGIPQTQIAKNLRLCKATISQTLSGKQNKDIKERAG